MSAAEGFCAAAGAQPTIPPTGAERDAMRAALRLARQAAERGEVPVGAVVLDAAGRVVGSGANTRRGDLDVAGHAEIHALRSAQRARNTAVLTGCTLVVTLEPCVMCAGAALAARVARVVFGAWEEKTGAAGSVYDVLRDGRLPYPVPEVTVGVDAADSARLLAEFFSARRADR